MSTIKCPNYINYDLNAISKDTKNIRWLPVHQVTNFNYTLRYFDTYM